MFQCKDNWKNGRNGISHFGSESVRMSRKKNERKLVFPFMLRGSGCWRCWAGGTQEAPISDYILEKILLMNLPLAMSLAR